MFLAKEAHRGIIGINLLTKIQMPTLPILYGALLAGVDYVLMGAGIPRGVPEAIERLAAHEPAQLRFDVEGASNEPQESLSFSPREVLNIDWDRPLKRPRFLPIVSSHTLATMLSRKIDGISGFVLEYPSAGGHNAPPRGKATFTSIGEPIYGDRDRVDLEQMKAIGLPFWLAGGYGREGGLEYARAVGATGIQVGTLFALSKESGLSSGLKQRILKGLESGEVRVRTDPRASPTGFPFKIIELSGAEPRRRRKCDVGCLRTAVRVGPRTIYRCPAEPTSDFVRKGGSEADTIGRRCLCNGLLANVGLGQSLDDEAAEPPLLTFGETVWPVLGLANRGTDYLAQDVVDFVTRPA